MSIERRYWPLIQKQLVEVEGGVAAIDVAEFEEGHDLLGRDDFAVLLRRPTEQAEVVAHGLGDISCLGVGAKRRALVALAHLGAVTVQDQGHMGEVRRLRAEGPVKLDVLRGVGEMILSADHMGDLHLDVVDHADEVKDPGAVGAAERQVGMGAGIGQVELDLSANLIVDEDLLAG